jgi:hypothetical protein
LSAEVEQEAAFLCAISAICGSIRAFKPQKTPIPQRLVDQDFSAYSAQSADQFD